ncbi:MAG: tyrosine-type recombinase/integrase [Xanthobacteraceae bacterium]
MTKNQVAAERHQVPASEKETLNEICKLTDVKVRNAKPKAGRYEIADNGSGLRLIVQTSGHKSYVTMTRLRGEQIKITHGDADAVALHDAREQNAAAIKQAKNGVDPRKARKDAKAKRQIAEASTFEAVALLYLDAPETKQLRSVDQIRDMLERLAFPVLGSTPVADIKRSDIHALLDRIDRNNGLVTGDRTFSVISQVLKFHARRSDDYVFPLIPGMRKDHAKERDRVLTDDEIRAIWKHGDPFTQFLLLTAGRRDEVASMQRSQLEGDEWVLLDENNKGKVYFARPLPKAALAILARQPRNGPYVFGSDDQSRPFRSFSRLKADVDEATGVREWKLHDLRRTARTLMARAGVPKDDAERCMGHAVGSKVSRIYDRWEYPKERRRAYQKLAKLIERIVNPPPKKPKKPKPLKDGNVYQLRRA